MRFRLLILTILLPGTLLAQIPRNDPDFIKGGRISVGAQKKITSKVEVHGESEFRVAGKLLRDMRIQESAGVSYLINPYLKTGFEYSYIGKMEYRSDFSSQTRFKFDVTGRYRPGPWRLSLRERVQLSHRPGEFNTWQNTRNALELKSRLLVGYKIDKRWTPYVAAELRNILNAPTLADYSYNPSTRRYETPHGKETGEPGWMIAAHDDCYLNRIRGIVGTEIKKNKHNSFKVYALLDWCYDLDIDTNGKGTRLKSLVYDPTWMLSLCASYIYSF